jgi:hypothetical protein
MGLHTCFATAGVLGIPAAPVISTLMGFLLLQWKAIVMFDQRQVKSQDSTKNVSSTYTFSGTETRAITSARLNTLQQTPP